MKQFGIKLWNLFEKIVRAVVGFFLRLVHITLSEAQWEKFMQFVKFCLVGCTNALVNFISYSLMLFLLGLGGWDGNIGSFVGADAQIATIFAFLISVINSYYWNYNFVFGSGSKRSFSQHLKAFCKVMLSYSFAGIFLSFGLNLIWINLLSLPKLLANPLNQIISIPINFLLNKFWAFKE